LEADSVVVTVEVGWVFSDEDISENEVVETSWEVASLNSKEAFSFSVCSNLKSVFVGGEGIVGGVDGESQVWEVLDVGAVLFDRDSVNEWADESLWSNKEGSSGVDDGFVFGGANLGLASLLDGVELECPVLLLNNLMGRVEGEVLRVKSWEDHVAVLADIVEVERETLVREVSLIHPGWEPVNRDAAISESEDTGHLGSVERHTFNMGNFSEAHGGFDVSDSGNIFGDGS